MVLPDWEAVDVLALADFVVEVLPDLVDDVVLPDLVVAVEALEVVVVATLAPELDVVAGGQATSMTSSKYLHVINEKGGREGREDGEGMERQGRWKGNGKERGKIEYW